MRAYSLCEMQRQAQQQAYLQPAPMAAPQPTSLYVKNLPADADKLFLYEHFAPHGGINSVRVRSRPRSWHST
jgi:RNA recognition motif-containing protein